MDHRSWLDQNPLRRWRFARHPKPISKREAAQMLDVHHASFVIWENGKYIPNENSMESIERITGITRAQWLQWLAQRPTNGEGGEVS